MPSEISPSHNRIDPDLVDPRVVLGRLPLLLSRQVTSHHILAYPEAATVRNPGARKRARAREAAKGLDSLVAQRVVSRHDIGTLPAIPFSTPLYATHADGRVMNARAVSERLEARRVHPSLIRHVNAYHGQHAGWAGPERRRDIAGFLANTQYTENTFLVHLADFYIHLLRTNPAAAASLRFRTPANAAVDLRGILARHARLLTQWDRKDIESDSTVTIDRGFGPIVVLLFIRPVPVKALLEIHAHLKDLTHYEIF